MNPDSFSNLLNEFLDLQKKILDPNIVKDHKVFGGLTKRVNQIEPAARKIQELKQLQEQLKEAKEMSSNETDNEMKELALQEMSELEAKIETLEAEINEMLKKSDPNDSRNVILEIRAGTGGDEAALFASDLSRMYTRFAEQKGWKVQILNTNYTGTGGIKEIIISISGENVYGTLKYESGVHRVQRVPATESSGRIHTSAASVVVLPEVDDLDVEIKPDEIRVDVFRSGGAGGQHVNKTESAVRITHIPTGIVVACQDERSQLQNKERAMSILKSKIYELEMEKQTKSASEARKSSIQSGDRSAKIRTYNFPESRITDHRIKETWHNLLEILDGNLGEVISQTSELLNANS